jgi:hypothetical protein
MSEPDAGGDDTRRKGLLERSLTTRFGLRLHMALMLAAAFAVGFAGNLLMLRAGFTMLVVRWVLAYAIGYVVLFIAMRCWLAYVGVRPFTAGGAANVVGDTANNMPIGWPSGGGGGGDAASGAFRGGGGRFGGGGASGSFDGRALAGGHAGTSSGSSHGVGLGDIFDGDDAGKLLVLIAVIVAVIAAFGGGIVFMIVAAPHLLVDVAFGAAITGGVVPATRRVVTSSSWETSVVAATWKPVAAMLAVLVIAGLVFSHYFPGVPTLGQAFASLR